MASIKISELNEYSSIEDEDIIPIVDLSANETKKLTINKLLNRNYSTSEIKTNMKWINGKPIYRKVIYTNSLAPTESGNLSIAHEINNMEEVININCMANNGGGSFFDFNNYTQVGEPGMSDTSVKIFVDESNIIIYNSAIISYASAYFILEYTKTTD